MKVLVDTFEDYLHLNHLPEYLCQLALDLVRWEMKCLFNSKLLRRHLASPFAMPIYYHQLPHHAA